MEGMCLEALRDDAVAELQLHNPIDKFYLKDLWWIKQKRRASNTVEHGSNLSFESNLILSRLIESVN